LNNKVSTILFSSGIIIIIIGIITGLYMSIETENIVMFILYGGASFISGMLIIGFAEVITLLTGIKSEIKLKAVNSLTASSSNQSLSNTYFNKSLEILPNKMYSTTGNIGHEDAKLYIDKKTITIDVGNLTKYKINYANIKDYSQTENTELKIDFIDDNSLTNILFKPSGENKEQKVSNFLSIISFMHQNSKN
jgi:hypothetical protein